MSILSKTVKRAMDNYEQRPSPVRKVGGIKTTRPFTVFVANNFAKGRVGRHSMMGGRTAIVPDGFEMEAQYEPPPVEEPVSRSIVSDGAGIFNTQFLQKR